VLVCLSVGVCVSPSCLCVCMFMPYVLSMNFLYIIKFLLRDQTLLSPEILLDQKETDDTAVINMTSLSCKLKSVH
jgi:hypothetical protein